MVDLDADLAAIFDGDDLDQTAAVFTTSGGAVTVNGFFTSQTEALSMLSGEIEENAPSFSCRTAAAAGVKNGNTAVINAVTYTVKRKQNLGAGMTLIYLKT